MTVPRAAPAASTARCAAAGVKADRRSPEGLGLDTGEDRRTLTPARSAITPGPADPASAAADNKIDLHRITHIMPLGGRVVSLKDSAASPWCRRRRRAPR